MPVNSGRPGGEVRLDNRPGRLRIAGDTLMVGLAAGAPAAALAQGSIAGQVTDQTTGEPLRVVLTGPNRIETTNREGRSQFRSVATGSYQLRVPYGPNTPPARNGRDRSPGST